jgi:hypothetical protein
MARAQAVAAGSSESATSSAVQGAVVSANSQGGSAVQYFDSQIGLDDLYQQYAKQAGKYAKEAEDIMAMVHLGGTATGVGMDIYGMANEPKPTSQTESYTSFNNTAAASNFANNSAFSSFGSSLDLPSG